MDIRIITLSYNAQGKGEAGASGPDALLKAGLAAQIESRGHRVLEPLEVELTPQELSQYGGWNRVAIANGSLSKLVAEVKSQGSFVLALLSDCNGLLGMLGGLQAWTQSGSQAGSQVGSHGNVRETPRGVGFIYVDAHGDYNTPDTSPSGMLGGMPVAVAAGKCLPRLRQRSGITHPVPYSNIVLAGMRDLDELEAEAIREDRIAVIREQDLRDRSKAMHDAVSAVSRNSDTVLVHVDLDILDPGVAPAAGLPSPGGLTGTELGQALSAMLGQSKAAALSIASYRADMDDDGGTLSQVMEAILLAVDGLKG